MVRFLEDNLCHGIDNMEERFLEYCYNTRQYENQQLPQKCQ